jgi:dipeptidyl aminopeptidase/acylaminoacyl peptidase
MTKFSSMIVILISGLYVSFLSSVDAQAEDMKIRQNIPQETVPISAFVADSSIDNVKISPDGKSIVFLAYYDNIGSYLFVADLNEQGVSNKIGLMQVAQEDKDTHRIADVNWANNDRVLFKLFVKTKVGGTKIKAWTSILYSVSRDGKQFTELRTDGSKAGKKLRHFSAADIINVWRDDPNHILVEKPRHRDWLQSYRRGEVSDVYKLNIYTGEMELYMKSPKISGVKLNDWYADQGGNIRFGYGEDRKGKSVMVIRGKNDEDWKRLSDNELFEEGKFTPLMFGSQPNEFYVLSSLATGRDAVFKFDISSGELDGKIYEHDNVDVSNLIYSHTKQKPLAAIYHDGKRQKVYFDKQYEGTISGLEKAAQGDVFIQSRSNDERNMIVFVNSDQEPGSYYHYDVEQKKLNFLGTKLSKIQPQLMATVKPITYMARDGVQISAYLTIPNTYKDEPLPAIILPHSYATGRDYWGWDYTAQYLANRGYIVIQPNYRGSAGYGDRFASLGRGEWGGDMQKDLADAAFWAIDEGYAKEDNICIMGKLYGGYAALMGVASDPNTYKCAIAWSGVSDIKQMFKDDDAYNTEYEYYQRIAGDKKKKELTEISPITFMKDIKVPILLMHGEDDQYHSVKQSRKFAKALKKAKKSFDYFEFEETKHLLDTEVLRQKYLEIVEGFLVEHNPTPILLKMQNEKTLAKKHKSTRSNR